MGGGRAIYGAGLGDSWRMGGGPRFRACLEVFTPLAGGNGKVSIGGADGSW